MTGTHDIASALLRRLGWTFVAGTSRDMWILDVGESSGVDSPMMLRDEALDSLEGLERDLKRQAARLHGRAVLLEHHAQRARAERLLSRLDALPRPQRSDLIAAMFVSAGANGAHRAALAALERLLSAAEEKAP